MSFERPALKKIVERIESDLRARLTSPQLRRSDAVVYARVLGAVSHALHGHIEWISKQLFFDTAESEFLDRWASIFGLSRKPASKAIGSVTFTFADKPVEVPIGTILQSDLGSRFKTTTPVIEQVSYIEALESGTFSNLEEGEKLFLTSPIAGVKSVCESRGVSGGVESESDDDLRERLLLRVREPPHGGTKEDYVAWALEVEGVTRAWAFPKEDGLGSVTVRFVCDDLQNIVPTQDVVLKVKAHIDSVRPVTARVKVSSVQTEKTNFTISNLRPDDQSVKERVKEELTALFMREGEPGGRIYLSHIRAAISAALGEEDHTLISPTADIVPRTGVLPVVGDITWQ